MRKKCVKYFLILSIFTVFSQFFLLTNNEKIRKNIKRKIQIAEKETTKKNYKKKG